MCIRDRFRAPLLRLLFGTIEDDVMQSALTYLTVSVFSYPVLAIYNAGAALFRAQGNSRISMLGLRLVAGYILAVHFGMGAIGIWIAMIGDWLCRSICFFLRDVYKRQL